MPTGGVGLGVGEGYPVGAGSLFGPEPVESEDEDAGAGPTICTDCPLPKHPLNAAVKMRPTETRENMADANPPSARFSVYQRAINCGMPDTESD